MYTRIMLKDNVKGSCERIMLKDNVYKGNGCKDNVYKDNVKG